jgi:hypothetical protein
MKVSLVLDKVCHGNKIMLFDSLGEIGEGIGNV